MLIGYARISKADGSQSLDLQRDALREAGVSDDAIYEDQASGQREDRPGLAAFLKAARQGDVIVIWRLDRLGRNLHHLVNLVQDLNDRDIGIRVLAGQGASIDTTTASGKLVFALFAALAEFEREDAPDSPLAMKWLFSCSMIGSFLRAALVPHLLRFFPGFSVPVDLSTGVVVPTTCSLTTCLTTCMVYP